MIKAMAPVNYRSISRTNPSEVRNSNQIYSHNNNFANQKTEVEKAMHLGN